MGEEKTIQDDNLETESVLSFVSSVKTNEDVDITKQFVFQCIDQYFEENKKRQELIDGFSSKKKKGGGGMDLNSVMGIGMMSLIPILTKQLNLTEIFNKSNIQQDKNAGNKQEDFINLPRRPEKPKAPEPERTDNIKYEKV